MKVRLDLQFFGKADKEGRTEKATSKKRDEARKEGQVAKSQEVGTAFSLLMVFWGIKIFGAGMAERMQTLFFYSLSLISDIDQQFSVTRMSGFVVYMLLQVSLIVLPIFAIAAFTGFITNYIQVGWHPTYKPLKPKFNKLNPVSGFKKLFSMQKFMEFPKSIAKLSIIGVVIYAELRKEYNNILIVLDLTLIEGLSYIADLCIRLGVKVGAWYMIVAVADYAYNKYTHEEGLKMTKQQIKDEYKNQEGDPKVKAKIKAKMREVSMRRMMQSVPGADVIITNPTHYAVALKYEKEAASAPVVVAKGVDFLAERIKKTGRENNVHIVENRHLARSIYSMVEIGQEIPEELFQSVAEILAYVYSIKNPA